MHTYTWIYLLNERSRNNMTELWLLWVDVEDEEKETFFGVMNMKDEEQQEHETQHVGRHYNSNILTTSDYRYGLLPRHMIKLLITNDVIN